MRQRGRNIRILAAALVAGAAALAAPTGAGAELLDDYYNEGIEPHADLGKSRSISKPRQLRLEFSGHTPAQINATFTVKCKLGGATRFSRTRSVSGISPVNAVVPIKRRFDSCRVAGAEARYADPFISGWLRIRVFGR